MMKQRFQRMARAAIATLTVTAATAGLGACQQPAPPIPQQNLEAIKIASDAYLAFERGDCETVYRVADLDRLEGWASTELRHSLVLAHGFCLDIDGKTSQALELYRQLIDEAPDSFAAEDAQERIRLIEAVDRDPEYARWIEDVIANAGPTEESRMPISRIPAEFPPIARAAGIEGFTVIDFGVTPDGETREPVVVASNPPLLFDGASLRAVRQWQFVEESDADGIERQVIRLLFRRNPALVPVAAEDLTE